MKNRYEDLIRLGNNYLQCEQRFFDDCDDLKKTVDKEIQRCVELQKKDDKRLVNLSSTYDDKLFAEYGEINAKKRPAFSKELIELKKTIVHETIMAVKNKSELNRINHQRSQSLYENCSSKNIGHNDRCRLFSSQTNYYASQQKAWTKVLKENEEGLRIPTITTLDAIVSQQLSFSDKEIFEPLYDSNTFNSSNM